MTKLRELKAPDRLRSILANLLFVAVLFPYLSPFRTPFDTQPWAILFALLAAALVFPVRIPRILVPLFGIAGYALVLFAIGLVRGTSDPLDGLRSIAGYLAVPLIAYAACRAYPFIDVRIFLAGVGTWLAVGLVQIIFDPYFLSWILPRKSTFGDLGRGATSLAPEPFYYAKVLIAFFVLNEIFRKEKRYGRGVYLAVAASLALQIVISYAGIGVVLLAAGAMAKAIALVWEDSRPDRFASAAVIVMLVAGAACFILLPGLHLTRGGDILRKAAMNPSILYRQDLSASNRLGNLAVGLYGGLIETKGLGFGIGSKRHGEIPSGLRKYFGKSRPWGGRISGGLVQGVYELGAVGLIFLLWPLWILVSSFLKDRVRRGGLWLTICLLYPVVAVSESPAFPLFAFLVGVHVFSLMEAKERQAAGRTAAS
jgi:hypothetical protein